jgi:hypothetical protein
VGRGIFFQKYGRGVVWVVKRCFKRQSDEAHIAVKLFQKDSKANIWRHPGWKSLAYSFNEVILTLPYQSHSC